MKRVLIFVSLFVTACGGSTATTDAGPTPDTGTTGDAGPRCGASSTECSGSCVDTMTDARNCGHCGMACAAGELCTAGACALTCPTGTTLCGTSCVDTRNDPMHCGTCTMACASGEYCSASTCTPTGGGCSMTTCDAMCVDTMTNPMYCGNCTTACTVANGYGACARGGCVFAGCDTGFEDCDHDPINGCELPTLADPRNCGGCGLSCGFYSPTCMASACVPSTTTPTTLHIASLGVTGCTSVDHESVTDDDRGGIASGTDHFYYDADGTAGDFSGELGGTLSVVSVTRQDGIFSDLATGNVYAFTTAGTPVSSPDTCDAIIDGFVALDPATLDPVGTPVALSTAITLPGSCTNPGIFASLGFVVLWDGANAHRIDLPSGTVTDLGAVVLDSPYGCENWAFWGVAETDGTTISLVYRADGATRGIVRTVVGTDVTTVIVDDTVDLSDMCSFTLDLHRDVWVWHYEGDGDLGHGEETAGLCPAVITR